jgi:hypothetical protein
MPSPEEILAVVCELEPRLPSLLGTEADLVQSQMVPLKEALVEGETNGEELLQLLLGYPAVAELLQQKLDQLGQSITSETSDEASDISISVDCSSDISVPLIFAGAYQKLPGNPSTVIPGTRYICPESDCSKCWFQIGLRTPPLCDDHGAVMVLATDEG